MAGLRGKGQAVGKTVGKAVGKTVGKAVGKTAVAEVGVGEVVVEEKKRKVPTRAGQCPAYVRGRLTDAIEKIADGFVKQAAAGSCQHLKLASELLERGVKVEPRMKSSAERYLEELETRYPGRLQEGRRTRGVDGKFVAVGDTAS